MIDLMSLRMAAENPASVRFEDLRSSIAQLDEEDRLVVALFYEERLSLDQIGEVLGASTDDVAAVFFRAHVGVGVVSSWSMGMAGVVAV